MKKNVNDNWIKAGISIEYMTVCGKGEVVLLSLF